MTPKQERFVQEYLVDLNATQAAIRAGVDLPNEFPVNGYYVYLLIDPRSGWIFYVGKGRGRRLLCHESEWRRGVVLNAKKFQAIGAIVEAGARVDRRIFATMPGEAAAYSLERRLIKAIGLERLTNAAPGAYSDDEKCVARARDLLGRIKPIGAWLAERPRSHNEVELYRRVQSHLSSLVNRLSPSVTIGARLDHGATNKV